MITSPQLALGLVDGKVEAILYEIALVALHRIDLILHFLPSAGLTGDFAG